MEAKTEISLRSGERRFEKREHFSGEVAFVFDLRKDAPFEVTPEDTVHLVSFADGAHTGLHRHSSRQILIFTCGEGFLEEEGGERRELAAGDVAICAPGVPHRHGARPGTDCTHLAIQSGEAEWLE